MAAVVAGYCGKCGAPFGADAGAFCGRCGHPIVAAPPVASGYSYPVMPTAAVPATQHRLTHLRLLVIGGGALAAVVIIITLIAVLARPQGHPCGFFCGPHIGARLLSPTSYQNTKWGYTIEYDAGGLKLANSDDNGTAMQSADGDGEVDFAASAGSDIGTANQNALAKLPTATFQNIQTIGPVRGAEIGFVLGTGTAYSAQLVPANGGSTIPVAIVIFSATRDGVVITVTAFSQQDHTTDNAPYGLDKSQVFDYPVSNTIWKGQG